MAKARIVGSCLLLALGCSEHPDEGTPVEPGTGVVGVPGSSDEVFEASARPIMGGTLTITKDGATAVAADPDRDQIFVVDLATKKVDSIQLQAGEVPGRIVEDARGHAYVVLRKTGQLARIDLATHQLSGRLDVCAAPRGIAYEARTDRLHVACQSGQLLSLDASDETLARQIHVADDLRDVVVSGTNLVLTRFRSAEVLVVDQSGQISQRMSPPADMLFDRVPSVAWRAIPGPDGEVRVMHQLAATNSGVSVGPSGYGDSGCGDSIVTPVMSAVSVSESGNVAVQNQLTLAGAAGPTDIAISSTGRIAIVLAGNAWSEGAAPSLVYASPEASGPVFLNCDPASQVTPGEVKGEPVAVAFDGQGRSVVQTREPATLQLEDGSEITLSEESRASTGLALFHMNTGAGIACASCHPEATEDSQTWLFAEIGPRRTQMVAGGISQRAPFHWEGDMPDFKTLVNKVMVERMNLPIRPNRKQMEAFVGWVDSVERPAPRIEDEAAVERGKALFFDANVGCNDCHSGPLFTNNRIVDVGTGGHFVVPTLVGVATRAPYIHDGCAETLKDRFSACGGGDQHGKTSQLSDAQIDDLVAFLETL